MLVFSWHLLPYVSWVLSVYAHIDMWGSWASIKDLFVSDATEDVKFMTATLDYAKGINDVMILLLSLYCLIKTILLIRELRKRKKSQHTTTQ